MAFAVINTTNRQVYPNVMHDAAAPYAVAEFSDRHPTIRSIRSRHATMRGAQIACGKCEARACRGDPRLKAWRER